MKRLITKILNHFGFYKPKQIIKDTFFKKEEIYCLCNNEITKGKIRNIGYIIETENLFITSKYTGEIFKTKDELIKNLHK